MPPGYSLGALRNHRLVRRLQPLGDRCARLALAPRRRAEVRLAQLVHELGPQLGPALVEQLGADAELLGDGQVLEPPGRHLGQHGQQPVQQSQHRGEPIRLFIELEQDADLVSVFRHQGGRRFLVGSTQGRGFIVPEDECLANTRKGKQVLNVAPPDEARALAVAEGELAAVIGENRKMVIFPLEQVPEMARGRGVRLQRYKDGGLSDLKTFKAQDGLAWTDSAGRAFSLSLRELADWRGNRADAGRLAPKGFPKSNTFGRSRS